MLGLRRLQGESWKYILLRKVTHATNYSERKPDVAASKIIKALTEKVREQF